jgi:hypothetical protein
MAQVQDASVARAIFVTALTRPEPGSPTISRDDGIRLAKHILRFCNVCTKANIKV